MYLLWRIKRYITKLTSLTENRYSRNRDELKKLYDGTEESFESFLSEHFFDLHYFAKPNAKHINLAMVIYGN